MQIDSLDRCTEFCGQTFASQEDFVKALKKCAKKERDNYLNIGYCGYLSSETDTVDWDNEGGITSHNNDVSSELNAEETGKIDPSSKFFDFNSCVFDFYFDLNSIGTALNDRGVIELWDELNGCPAWIHLKKSIIFHKAIFRKTTSFRGAIFQYADFSCCHFIEDTYFTKCSFTNADFTFAVFDKIANFAQSHFCGSTNYNETFFGGECNLSYCNIEGRMHFISVNYKGCVNASRINNCDNPSSSTLVGTISFDRCHFYKSAMITCCKCDTFSISETICCIFISFHSIVCRNLKIESCVFDAACFDKIQISSPIDRQTARVVKHEYMKSDNRVDANRFYVLEMNAYWKEILGTPDSCDQSNKPTIHTWSERSTLCLHWLSTRYGQSWIWGLVFVFCGLLFRFITLLGCLWGAHCIVLSLTWEGLLNLVTWFVDAADPLVFLPGKSTCIPTIPSGWLYVLSIVLLYIARIWVAYGIWQLVQAFRKLRQ